MEGRRPTDWELSTAPLEGRGMGKGNEADSTSLSDPMESVLLLHRGPEVRSKQHPRPTLINYANQTFRFSSSHI